MIFYIANRSYVAFGGIHRTVIDPFFVPLGVIRGFTMTGKKWAMGRKLSRNSQIIDLELDIQPREVQPHDTAALFADTNPWVDNPLPPADRLQDYYGSPFYNGVPLQLLPMESRFEGAHFVMTWRARCSPMLVCKVVLKHVPGQPWAVGTRSVYCSNPSIPDMQSYLSTVDFRMGTHETFFGTTTPYVIGDGQVIHTPIAVAFVEDARAYAELLSKRELQGHAVRNVGSNGRYEQARFDPSLWSQEMHRRMLANIGTYKLPEIGSPPNTTSTGDAEQQGAEQGNESLYPGGVGGEVARILSAMGHGRYPCHHLIASGDPMLPENIPNAMLWQGRPLWISKTSDDIASWELFGKTRAIDINGDSSGWYGPDPEHALMHDIAAGYELSGEECLLDELLHWARNYLWEDTVDPALSTSMPNVGRAWGWRGLQIGHWARLLPNGSFRDRVLERWKQRVDQVYTPAHQSQPFGKWAGVFGSRPNEIAASPNSVFPYQMAVGAFGMWRAGVELNHEPSKKIGREMASLVLDVAYEVKEDGSILDWEMLAVDANGETLKMPYVEGQQAHRTGWFRYKWLPLALCVVIESGYGDVKKAQEIRTKLLKEYLAMPPNHDPLGNFPADWFPDPVIAPASPAST